MKDKIKDIISRIDDSIESLNKNKFTIYFFVIDTKGTPNGSTQYIYEMAKELMDFGYKVAMLHQEENFVGVSSWLGEEYSVIPHYRIDNTNIKISAADFLLIPEIFANVMSQTKDLPCKRIVVCQNINYITEFIPLGVSWSDYKVTDVLTTSQTQADDILDLFPRIKTKVISPEIPAYFRDDDSPKKLMVCVSSKDDAIINRITKQFHWKYPEYRWVTFANAKGLSRDLFADTLRESQITLWIDDETYFGYVPVEAIKSGSIVIGKIPNVIPEWMYNDDKTALCDAGLWFTSLKDVHKIIANVVKSIMDDDIPEELYTSMKSFETKYTKENRKEQIKLAFQEYVSDRIKDMENAKNKIINENK